MPELVALRPQLVAMYCADNGRPCEEPVRSVKEAQTLRRVFEENFEEQQTQLAKRRGRSTIALNGRILSVSHAR